jgi:hypothetical protein
MCIRDRWLREEHNISVLVDTHKDFQADVNDEFEWYPKMMITNKLKVGYNNYDHGSYELALEAGLTQALKVI